MAQAFITVYNKTYRKFGIERRHPALPIDKFAETVPEADIWLIKKSLEEQTKEGGRGLDAANKSIKKMYRNRLWTVYQKSYCTDLISKENAKAPSEGSFENTLLESSAKVYGPRTQKIAPPRPTARRLLGYLRPENMYTPLTDYQHWYGQLGYHILNGEFLSNTKEPEKEQPKTPEYKTQTKATTDTKKTENESKQNTKGDEKSETCCGCIC